jgi:DNA (cytosine-5)-methyltransferase 1
MMRHLDLFSGIGGFALGLARTNGFETVAFCDSDPKTHLVLKKNFPGVPIFSDVKTLKGEDVGTIDIVTGGFPCQDLSVAGKGKGLAGERSGLWFEMHRIIKETQPKWVIAENVSVLRSRGLDQVLRSLDEIGYDAEWHCIPASAIGAPHRRDRIWIVAHPRHSSGRNSISGSVGEDGDWGHDTGIRSSETVAPTGSSQASSIVADTDNSGNRTSKYGVNTEWSSLEQRWEEQSFRWFSGCRETMAYANSQGLQKPKLLGVDPAKLGFGQERSPWSTTECSSLPHWRDWAVEPNVGRVAHGIPNRMDRLKQLGNALVPQIVTIIGNAILEADTR